MSEKLTDLTADIAAFIHAPEDHDFDRLVRRAESFRHKGAPLGDLLVRQAATSAWHRFCLDRMIPSPVLSLVVADENEPSVRLAGEIEQTILSRWAAGDSLAAMGPRGVDARKTRGFLAARQRDNQPVLLVATRSTLSDLIRSLQRLDLRFRLAAASVAVVGVETSGSTARAIESFDLSTLIELTEDYLGLAPDRFVQRLDPAPKTRLFTDTLSGGDREHFVAPHWVRLEIVELETRQPTAPGETGRLRIHDLANLGGPMEIETQIQGTLEPEGFRLLEPRS